MEYKKVNITPKLAEEWLKRNTCNRPLSTAKVIDYAVEMAEGRWGEESHQGISFAEDGSLVDGQHRLAAIALAEVTLCLWVATNQPIRQREIYTRDVIDRGPARTPGDVLSLERHIQNSKDVSAITHQIFRILHIGQTGPNKVSVPVQAYIYDIYKREIDTVIGLAKGIKGLRNGQILACFAFAAKDHFDEAIIFEEAFWDGANLGSGSPILAFRDFVMGSRGERASTIHPQVLFRACLYCLYCHIKGKSVSRMTINNLGANYFLKKQADNLARIQNYLGSRGEVSRATKVELRKKIAERRPAWCPRA